MNPQVFLVLCVFLSFVAKSDAIECYQCMWTDLFEEKDFAPYQEIVDAFLEAFNGKIKLDKSCNAGKKPSGRLASKCGNAFSNDSCSNVNVPLTMQRNGKNLTANFHFSGCSFELPEYNQTGCIEKTLEEIVKSVPEEIRKRFDEYLAYINPDMQSNFEFCKCKGDKCNEATRLALFSVLFITVLLSIQNFI